MHCGASRLKKIEPFVFYRTFTRGTRKITFTRHDFGHVEKSSKQQSFELQLVVHEHSTMFYTYHEFQPVQLSV